MGQARIENNLFIYYRGQLQFQTQWSSSSAQSWVVKFSHKSFNYALPWTVHRSTDLDGAISVAITAHAYMFLRPWQSWRAQTVHHRCLFHTHFKPAVNIWIGTRLFPNRMLGAHHVQHFCELFELCPPHRQLKLDGVKPCHILLRLKTLPNLLQ